MTTITITRNNLTNAEQRVLALVGAHGTKGLASLGHDAHPSLEAGNTPEAEALWSLRRFGLVAEGGWTRGMGWPYTLTPEGEAIYADQRAAVARYSDCPACVRMPCVCSYSLACMGVNAPALGVAEGHASLGCHGTHD